MIEALLIAAILVAALSCPVMMWLGRRGIGPGCGMMRSRDPARERERSLEELRRRERELAAQIADLDAGAVSAEASPEDTAPARSPAEIPALWRHRRRLPPDREADELGAKRGAERRGIRGGVEADERTSDGGG